LTGQERYSWLFGCSLGHGFLGRLVGPFGTDERCKIGAALVCGWLRSGAGFRRCVSDVQNSAIDDQEGGSSGMGIRSARKRAYRPTSPPKKRGVGAFQGLPGYCRQPAWVCATRAPNEWLCTAAGRPLPGGVTGHGQRGHQHGSGSLQAATDDHTLTTVSPARSRRAFPASCLEPFSRRRFG